MTASRYLLSAKYFSPLSKYFCLRTLGSREQPVKRPAMTQQESKSRMVIERRIFGFSNGGRRKRAHRCTDSAQVMILQAQPSKQLLESQARRPGSFQNFRLTAECNFVIWVPR